ncbi:MAG: 16S rRNA (uracil(1498)-N(3))-methyltransferase [Sphingobium sp. 66-54]|nr:MAG: 16S rRNA (uracil(1498)-N(3))-methyltransferase [Sphingobium sp. 66-54]
MPATPAWPPRSAPRLYVEAALGPDAAVPVEGNAAHYLLSVMRVRDGDTILLFDGVSGEWVARAEQVRKRDLVLRCEAQTRPLETVPDFWLCVAPIKRGRIDLVAEKACELGVARLIPARTERSVVDKVNSERLRAHLIEAAEQCGRTALPDLADLTALPALLADWPAERTLFFADETGGQSMDAAFAHHPGPAALLIGPEGGFTPAERALILACPQAVPISLGPRILRAETAAIAATACWMARNGDWSSCETK